MLLKETRLVGLGQPAQSLEAYGRRFCGWISVQPCEGDWCGCEFLHGFQEPCKGVWCRDGFLHQLKKQDPTLKTISFKVWERYFSIFSI